MRVRSVQYTSPAPLPVWADALYGRLSVGGRGAPPAVLPLPIVLDELVAVAAAVVSGRGTPNRENRISLFNDMREACDALGTAVAREIGTPLLSFKKEFFGRLPDFLADGAGARLVEAAGRSLLADLLSDAVIRAAWADVVAAFKKPSSAVAVGEQGIALLVDLTARRGHDWQELGDRLASILRDDAFAIEAAGGPVEKSSLTIQGYGSVPTGVDLDARLDLCAEALLATAPFDDVVVWLCYADATVGKAYRECGDVGFYDWRCFEKGSLSAPQGVPAPPELADPRSPITDGLPEQSFVLVRVPVVGGERSRAAERAVELADGILALTGNHSGWRRLHGTPTFSAATGWYGDMGFTDQVELDTYARSGPVSWVTGENLGLISDVLIDGLETGDERVRSVANEAAWLNTVRSLPDPRQRLVLRLRVVEHLLPKTSDDRHPWQSAANRHLKHCWIREALIDDLQDAVANLLPTARSDGGAVGLRQLIFPDVPGSDIGRFRFDVDAAVRELPGLSALSSTGSTEARLAGEALQTLSTASNLLHEIRRREREFSALLARTARVRNAITHGTPVVPAVLHSVGAFAAWLSAACARAAALAIVDGEEFGAFLERRTAQLASSRDALAAGAYPLGYLS